MSSANGTGQESTSPPFAAPGSSRKVTRRRTGSPPAAVLPAENAADHRCAGPAPATAPAPNRTTRSAWNWSLPVARFTPKFPEHDSYRATRDGRAGPRPCQPTTSRLESASMLNQVADGVWVRQSEWVWSNATVVRGEGGLFLVDPGIDGSDLNQLADDVDRLGIPVAAGFSTHPHGDHHLAHH